MSLLQNIIPSLSRASARDDATEVERTVKPAYRIRETPEAYAVTVYLPGVAKDAIELTAEDNQFRLTARRAWKQPAEWTALHRESSAANFELVLVHDNAINGEKISAELRDGVLRLSLPKTEAVKPRKIAIA